MKTQEEIQNPGTHLIGEDWFPIEGLSLYAAEHPLTGPVGPHDHDCEEIVISTRGRATYIANGREWNVSYGDVFVSLPGDVHEIADVHDWASYVILYDFRHSGIPLRDLAGLKGYHALFTVEPSMRARQHCQNRLCLSPEQMQTCTALIEPMIRELETQAAGCRFMVAALFEQLVAHLSRYYSDIITPPTDKILRIAQVLRLMESRYMDALDTSDLAAAGSMSERTLRREFKRALGVSPIEHLNAVRIRRAEGLLLQTPMNITEIAFHCGFSDSSYFSRIFRRINRMSPREYRKRV